MFGGYALMTIRPISDLRNYPNVLEEISAGNPVHLTKNGRAAYVIMDNAEFEQYTKEKAAFQLLLELNKVDYENVVPYDEVKKIFEEK